MEGIIKDGWKVIGAELPTKEGQVWVMDDDGHIGLAEPLFFPFKIVDGQVRPVGTYHDGDWGGLYSPDEKFGKMKFWKEISCQYSKISVFDMDGTFINTATPEIGKDIWFKKTGTEWPHSGWWGRKESLDLEVFDNDIIEDTLSDYYDESKSDTTLLVLMTGRHLGLTKQVKAILDKHGLRFHEIKLNDGGETIEAKKRQLTELFFKYPLLNEVEMWEDRIEHVEEFKKFFKWKSFKFNINYVK